MMIKICYVIGQLVRHGAERQLYELVKGIDRDKFNPMVISLSKGGYWADEIRKLDIEVIELERKSSKEFYRLFKLIKILREKKPQIVHTYAYSANIYGRIAAQFSSVPLIISSERNSVDVGTNKTTTQIKTDKILSFFTDAIICNSFNASNALIEKYSFNSKKIFTVHNGIDFTNFVADENSGATKKQDLKVIGAIGRLYRQKNYTQFLNVIKIILDIYGSKGIEIRIVGDGPLYDELKQLTVQLGIHKNIIFLGAKEDIPRILKDFDIFLMTSLYEGLSNAMMEAMAMAVPVVATDVGGNRELINSGKTGYLCSLDDTDALAAKVLYLLKNKEIAEEMGREAQKKILSEFSSEIMVIKTEEIYLNLMNRTNTNL